MLTYQIVYWRDIPAQVRFRSDGERYSRTLSPRFQEAIDEAAMRSQSTNTDDYLEEWHTSEWLPVEGDAQGQSEEIISELETAYSQERLNKLVKARGFENPR